ncbi:MAG: hypothetical protein KDE62_16945 [Calditrichaeota bacterium]|nr:hypothetical protein [Calditrichota bacterium]
MKLGAFSISLAVKDIAVSKAFYEKLGFSVFGGDITQKRPRQFYVDGSGWQSNPG